MSSKVAPRIDWQTKHWWLAAPAVVLVLTFWCQLHGLATGRAPVSFDVSAPWAVRVSAGWIIAAALLLRAGGRMLASAHAHRFPWAIRACLLGGIVALTLTAEGWLLGTDPSLAAWLYARSPVHLTFAIILLGAWLLALRPHVSLPTVAVLNDVTPPAPPPPTMLDVLTGTGRTQVRLDEVECLEADRNYINVHTERRSYLLRRTLASVEKSLCSAGFRRIHRSTIVNCNKIRERRPGGVLVLRSGRTVRVSRAFADRMR